MNEDLREMTRLYRTLMALNATNEAILRCRSAAELYPEICTAALKGGSFLAATVFQADRGVVWAGAIASGIGGTDGSAAEARISVHPILPEGPGIVGTALVTGEVCVSNDFLTDPDTGPWHELARECGVGSGAAVPVVRSGKVSAIVVLYAAEPGMFDAQTIDWLIRVADNVAFALDRFDTEASLFASEQRVRGLVELTSDWLWETDANLQLVLLEGRNEPAAESFQQVMTSGPGQTDADARAAPGAIEALRPQLERREMVRDFEYAFTDARGVRRAVRMSAKPLFDAAGCFAGYLGTARDITEKKRIERLRELEHTVTRRLSEAATPEKVIQAVLQVVCESEQWEAGGYFRVEQPDNRVRLVTGWRGPNATAAIPRFYADKIGAIVPGGGLLEEVVRTGRPLLTPDITKAAQGAWLDRAEATGERSALLIPIHSGTRVIGTLAFGGRAVREADERLLETVRVIADQVGQFLQRKTAEHEMRLSEARFRALTQLSSDYYWETDRDHRFLRYEGNDGADSELPPLGRLLGRTPWEFGHDIDCEGGWDEHRRKLGQRLPFHEVVTRRVAKDGTYRYASTSGEPMYDRKGEFVGYRGVTTDITDRRRIEDELRRHRDHLQDLVAEQTASLRSAKDEAESANRAKSTFLSNMSHELRTPMHAVLSFARAGLQRAGDGPLPQEKAIQYFDRIHQSASRLLHLLTDLLDSAKLDAGKMVYSMARVDMAEVVRSVSGEFEALAASRQIQIGVETHRASIAWGDPLRLGQVVRNLVSNALKWTPNGGTIRIVTAQTEEGTGDHDVRLLLTVSDTGPGIPAGELEVIFDEFTQSSRSKGTTSGTGLGLAICRKIVADHGGRVWATNATHGGAMFHCTLPVHALPTHRQDALPPFVDCASISALGSADPSAEGHGGSLATADGSTPLPANRRPVEVSAPTG